MNRTCFEFFEFFKKIGKLDDSAYRNKTVQTKLYTFQIKTKWYNFFRWLGNFWVSETKLLKHLVTLLSFHFITSSFIVFKQGCLLSLYFLSFFLFIHSTENLSDLFCRPIVIPFLRSIICICSSIVSSSDVFYCSTILQNFLQRHLNRREVACFSKS